MTETGTGAPAHVAERRLLLAAARWRPRLSDRRLHVALLLVGLAVAALSVIGYVWGTPLYYADTTGAAEILHVVGGVGFVLVGFLTWQRRPDNFVGGLMAIAGIVWFVEDLGRIDTPITVVVGDEFRAAFWAVLAHLAIVFPTGSTSSRIDRASILFTYLWLCLVAPFMSAAFFDPDDYGLTHPGNPFLVTANSTLNGVVDDIILWTWLGIAVLVYVLCLRHWRQASTLGRRALAPAFWVLGPIAAVVVIDDLISSIASPDSPVVSALDWTLAALLVWAPISFLVGVLRSQLARSAIGQLLIDIGSSPEPSVDLQSALVRTLGDPTLTVAYWLPDSRSYVAVDGTPVEIDEPGRTTTLVENEGEPIAALIHDSALETTPSSSTPSLRRPGSRSRTNGFRPTSAPSSRSSGSPARASSRPATSSGAGSSGTCTTVPSSAFSASGSPSSSSDSRSGPAIRPGRCSARQRRSSAPRSRSSVSSRAGSTPRSSPREGSRRPCGRLPIGRPCRS